MSSAQGSNIQRTCRDVFARTQANETRLTVAKIAHSPTQTSAQELAAIRRLKTSKEKVAYSIARLSAAGVSAEPANFRSWYLTKRPAVRFLPEGDSNLGQIVASMMRVFGTTFYYDPEGMDGAIASTDFKSNIIRVSQHTAFTGEPDEALFHEIRHVAMHAQEANGKASLLNGFAMRFIGKWPWENSTASYQRSLSAPELATWAQGSTFLIVGLKPLLEMAKISDEEMQTKLLKISNHLLDAGPIAESILAMASFEKEVFAEGNGRTVYNPAANQLRTLVFRIPFYLHVHTIPQNIFDSMWPPDLHAMPTPDRVIYFKTEGGKRLARQIALSFFEMLEKRARDEIAETARLKSLKSQLDAQFALSATNSMRTKLFKDFIRKALASKAPPGKPRPVRLRTVAEFEMPVSRLLPAQGFDFRNMHQAFLHKQDFRFGWRKSETRVHAFNRGAFQDIETYVQADAANAYYGLVELHLEKLGTVDRETKTLRLEWAKSDLLQIEQIVQRLGSDGYALVEAAIGHVSPVMPSWLPNGPALLVYEPVLRELRAIPPEVLNHRNHARYLEIFD